MKEKELKVARENVSALMQGRFVFNPEVFLNKTVLFDTSKIDEEKIIDRTLENFQVMSTIFTLLRNQEQMHFP